MTLCFSYGHLFLQLCELIQCDSFTGLGLTGLQSVWVQQLRKTCVFTWQEKAELVPTVLILQVYLYGPVTINHLQRSKLFLRVPSLNLDKPSMSSLVITVFMYLNSIMLDHQCILQADQEEISGRESPRRTSSHKNCLIDSSHIIYTIAEEQQKCQMTKKTRRQFLNKTKIQNI